MPGHYKDSLFRSLFSDEKTLRELYGALTGVTLGEHDRIVINTLDETLFTAHKNDLSFYVNGRLVVLIDHQSTANENMPFRFLEPVFRLLENSITGKKAIYQTKRIPLPYPEFYVLENSASSSLDYREMRLSEAFIGPDRAEQPNLELVVKVYNINEGSNPGIAARCTALAGYAAFVAKARALEKEIKKTYPDLDWKAVCSRAISGAITYCKTHDILKEYWETLSMEEENMLATEWNLEDALEVRWEEGREEGIGIGIEKGRNWVLDLVRQGYTAEQIEQKLAASSNQHRPG